MSARVGWPLRTVVALVVVVALAVAADANRRLVDLTDDSTLTLTAQTRDVLDSLDRDVEVTVFMRHGEPGRVEAVSLLDRYRRLNPRLDVEVVDPDEAPGEVRRLGVDPLVGGVALRSGDETEVVPTATEGDLTAGLARLVRDDDVVVCVTTGHGERAIGAPSGFGLGDAAGLLERDGHTVVEIDLLADPRVPERCSMVLMAAPEAALTRQAEIAVGEWLAADGRLLLLTDPVVDTAPAGLVADLGIGIERGLVFEGDAGNVVAGDVAAPIVSRYPSANPVVRRLAPTYFPGVQAITVGEGTGEGLTTTALAATSETSYLERRPLEPQFDPVEDVGGPITIAAAADRSRVEGVDVERTRALVVGDVDFVSDAFVREAGNAQFLRQATSWLTETEDLVALSPNVPRDRPLRLTDDRVTYAYALSVGLVPSGFLVAGALVWLLRRRR